MSTKTGEPHFSKPDLASAAIVVCQLADNGNTAAQQLVGELARNAAKLVIAGGNWMTDDLNEPTLIIVGSLAGRCETWQEAFVRNLWGMQSTPSTPPDNVGVGSSLQPEIGKTGRVGWAVPGFAVVRHEVDAATTTLRVARRWALTRNDAIAAIGVCSHVATSSSNR